MFKQHMLIAAMLPTIAAAQSRYAVLDASGDFGTHLVHSAFNSAINAARNEQVDTLIINIDSKGGLLEDAEEIARLMKANDDITYVVVVDQAIGASVWITASADYLLFSRSGAQGAAVAFHADFSRDSLDAEAQLNSAHAGIVAAIAESNGQPGEVYRAMIDPSASLWTYTDKSGMVVYDQNTFVSKQNAKQWDDAITVLTLTPNEAVELGLGTRIGRTDDILDLIGLVDPIEIRRPATMFKRESTKAARLDKRITKLHDELDDLVKQFNECIDRHEDERRDAEYDKPSAYNSDYKYDARRRRSYLERIERYQKALHRLQWSIKEAAKIHKRIEATLLDLNTSRNEMNEIVNYERFESDIQTSTTQTVKDMEADWAWSEEELKWCREQ